MSEDKNKLDEKLIAGHEYDGIKELDNPLPGWWLFIFYATIVFAAGYYYYYEFGSGPSSQAELAQDMAVIEEQRSDALEIHVTKVEQVQKTDAEIVALIQNKELMDKAKVLYDRNCKSCHADQLQGLIGPNLVDNAWIHTQGTVAEIVTVMRQGVLDKGMPPWENIISLEDLEGLAAYIVSQKGSNPPNAKAAEGTVYENY